ncbi:conjugative transfer protein MobI(A/C) [Shewanella baltica]|uniref:conjugative transfer protein MobI(A/C) n=1 Tax=Shewanella baltica TaxID=62322 RepID=UPI0024BAAFF5|nr:conjugative transfer protein MobI(A/C) [Shewanella baltica]
MSLPKSRWLDLLDPKLEEDRSEITEDLLEAEGREFVTELRIKLDHALAVIAVEAQQEADMYWSAHRSAREDASEDEQCRVGTRVRILGVSLVAEWYRNRFVEQVPGQKKRVLSTHIKKGRGHAYSMTHFKKEPIWAQELIQQVESRYASLRQRATALAKIRRALNEYERMLNKTHNDEV